MNSSTGAVCAATQLLHQRRRGPLGVSRALMCNHRVASSKRRWSNWYALPRFLRHRAGRCLLLSSFSTQTSPPPAPTKFAVRIPSPSNCVRSQLRIPLALQLTPLKPSQFISISRTSSSPSLSAVAPPSLASPWPAYSGCSRSFRSLILCLPLCRDAHKQTG